MIPVDIRTLLWVLSLFSVFSSVSVCHAQLVIRNAGFEEQGLDGWTGRGNVTVTREGAFEGAHALLLARTGENLVETSATSEPFAVTAGAYDVACAVRTDLYTQDMSFNAAVSVDFQDAQGKSLERLTIIDAQGKTAWRPVRKVVTAPEHTARGQVVIQFNKTHGQVWLDAVTIKPARSAVNETARRVTFATKYMGNMLYPDDDVIVEMKFQTPTRLAEADHQVTWDVRDYWSAPVSDRRTTALVEIGQTREKTWEYVAKLDARDIPLKVGPYYEVHTSVKVGDAPAVEDETSLAILPQSSAFGNDPGQLPFGTHNWDDRPEPYFALSARLGLRRCAVFWHWPAEAPYTPHYEGWDYDARIGYPKKYGLVPYALVYPAHDLERGESKHTDESLREGLRQTIELHKKDGMWGFQIGNEPPHWNAKMVDRDVEIYKVQYEAIKKADPSMVVIGSAIGPNEEFFKRGFQHYCDTMNIHGYGDLGEQRRSMRKYQELFAKYGGNKPIWTTEIGSMSQGLTRHEIACDIVRKATAFFADGGEFFTWFAITYPDTKGTRRGSYGDSMDLFSGFLEQYNPRHDAVGYFHYVDQIGTKKFVEEVTYNNGSSGFLFRDSQGNCVQVLWNLTGDATDVLVPLAGVQDVRLTQIDGSGARMNAGGKGVTVRVAPEPILLAYRQADGALAKQLETPAIRLDGALPELVQGSAGTFALNIAKGAGKPVLSAPATMKIEQVSDDEQADGNRRVGYRITVPSGSPARAARLTVGLVDEDRSQRGQLLFTVPVKSRINSEIRPLASPEPGKAGVELIVRNNGNEGQRIAWSVELAGESPMVKGEFDHGNMRPAEAYFTDVNQGDIELQAGEEKRVSLGLAQVERLTVYKVRAQIVDAGGKAVINERLMAGFAGVHRAGGTIAIDGNLDEAGWSKAPVLKIDEARQFFSYSKEGKWNGPQDLSGQLRFLWDDQNLYLSMVVTDDKFVNSKEDNELWAMDGLQMMFDPYRDREEKLGRYDYFGGIGKKGPQFWCGLTADGRAPTGEVKDITLAGKRTDTTTGAINYEMAIPWSRILPFAPAVGRNLGLGILINEDDGLGRETFLGWFSGAHSKTVNQVGDLILLAN